MKNDPSKRRLAKGLATLMGEIDQSVFSSENVLSTGEEKTLSIELISPNPRNPRRDFSEEDLADLAQSIREHGLLQPVVVRPTSKNGHFEIIAGERRWRAAQRAGLVKLPVVIREASDKVALELTIIENVQRMDLNSLEEAMAYRKLIDDHDYTQADLSRVIGKSRSHVANTLRLLHLPESVKKMLVKGALSAGHARALITASDPEEMALRVVANSLSVRDTEALLQESEIPVSLPRRSVAPRDPDTVALEKLLSDMTGLKIVISHKNSKGEVRLFYKTLDQLDDLCRRLQAAFS